MMAAPPPKRPRLAGQPSPASLLRSAPAVRNCVLVNNTYFAYGPARPRGLTRAIDAAFSGAANRVHRRAGGSSRGAGSRLHAHFAHAVNCGRGCDCGLGPRPRPHAGAVALADWLAAHGYVPVVAELPIAEPAGRLATALDALAVRPADDRPHLVVVSIKTGRYEPPRTDCPARCAPPASDLPDCAATIAQLQLAFECELVRSALAGVGREADAVTVSGLLLYVCLDGRAVTRVPVPAWATARARMGALYEHCASWRKTARSTR